jgi:putative DNA primase/helicase
MVDRVLGETDGSAASPGHAVDFRHGLGSDTDGGADGHDFNADGNDGGLPDGYRYTADGIEWERDLDGTSEWEWLCSPLEVLARTSDEFDQNHGLLLRVTTTNGTKHSWAMPMELCAGGGEAYRAHLLQLGLRLASGPKARNALHDLLMRVKPSRHVTSVGRAGWHDRTYVNPLWSCGPRAADVVFQSSHTADHRYAQRGTLAEWRAEVGSLARGNDFLLFSMSLAFAPALLKPLGEEGGIINLAGESSRGKTTCARAAASVYGSGSDEGFAHSWRITDNALEDVAFARCDGFLVLDEMSQGTPAHVSAIAYLYANGQGKGRADRFGNAQPMRQWRGLALSTGEQRLEDVLLQTGRMPLAGQQVRHVDVPASDAGRGLGLFENLHGEPNAQAFAERVKKAAGRNFGTAGPAFIADVADHYDDSIFACREAMDRFLVDACDAADGEQVRRIARRFALIAAAGELAIGRGIAPWPAGAAFLASLRLFSAWKAARGGGDNAEAAQDVELVRAYLEELGGQFASSESQRPRHCSGYIHQLRNGERRWLLFPSTWKKIFAGRDAAAAARRLAERGILLATGEGNYQRTCKVPGDTGKSMSFYVITEAVFGGAAPPADNGHDEPSPWSQSDRLPENEVRTCQD